MNVNSYAFDTPTHEATQEKTNMLAPLFRGVSLLVLRVKALVTVFFGSSLYSQTVYVLNKFPGLLPEIIANAALKYRRTVTSARYRVNPSTDHVEILCTVTNVTSWTVGAGLLVGEIGVATAVPGGFSYKPNYLPARQKADCAEQRWRARCGHVRFGGGAPGVAPQGVAEPRSRQWADPGAQGRALP